MKITRIEAFQVAWSPNEKPQQRSAFVLVDTDDGLTGVSERFQLAFDANNCYTISGAIRVGHALEELGYWWFEEPVQHYHIKATGEVAQWLSITVSAGEQARFAIR